MTKKICCVTTVEATLENFVVPAMRMLRQNGWDVTLICRMSPDFISRYQDEFDLVNIPFHRGISIKDSLMMPFKMAKLFKEREFDIVQYATPNASLYSSLGARMAGIGKRVYCQWGIRYVGSTGIMRFILRLLEKITCFNSTLIRPASRKNLEFAVSEHLYKADKAKVIGDGGTVGIDLSQYDPRKKDDYRNEVLLEYPHLKDKMVFAFVGRINRDKGIYELIEAFSRLQLQYPQSALLLIGDFDGELPTNLQHIRKNRAIISTGWTDNVPKYLSAADILVHPSYREGFSMVIQQAMAMELPVITTDIPGPSEVIEEGVTGILVQPKNTDSLHDAMAWAISHKKECRAMGVAGRLRCHNLFRRERMLRLTLEDREHIIKSK